MKILQIEDYFHPDAGYQVNILSKYLANFGNEVVIFCATMDKIPPVLTSFFGTDNLDEKDKSYEKEFGVRINRFPLKSYFSNRYIYKKEIFKRILEEKPDIIYVHGNDTYVAIKIFLTRKKYKCAIISDSHMLEMASVSKFSNIFHFFYKIFITPKILKYEIPVIRTQDDNYVSHFLGLNINKCPFIPLGSDTLLFHPDSSNRKLFRNKYGISEDCIVFLYAGKLDESKGAKLLADSLLKDIHSDKKVVFIIVGKTSGSYGDIVEQTLSKTENTILRFGTQKYRDLAIFFQAADFVLFPKQCSLSFYDAQACGCVVISEDNSINIDRNSHSNGFCFDSGNIDSLRKTIQMCAALSTDSINEMKANAIKFIKSSYDYSQTAKEYFDVIVDCFNHQKRESWS